MPEPLKGVIDWLTQPLAQNRPASALAVVEKLDALLKPATQRGKRPKTVPRGAAVPSSRPPRRGGTLILLAVLLLAALGGGLWYGGLLDGLLTKPLPVASPYRITAAAAKNGAAQLTGDAPDASTATQIRSAYATAAGVAPEDTAITLAQGVPSPDWPAAAADGMALAAALEDWTFDLSDKRARVTGLAKDRTARAAAFKALSGWATKAGLTLDMDVATGPKSLPAASVTEILQAAADCGPLAQGIAGDRAYALGDTISISGDVAKAGTADTLRRAIADIAGDRKVAVNTNVLNAPICTMRGLLPAASSRGMSVWLGNVKTKEANITGVFKVGDHVDIELRVPAALTGQNLWVGLAHENGNIFTFHPNPLIADDKLDDLGTVENGVRKVQILPVPYTKDGVAMYFSYEVTSDDIGKGEIYVVLSQGSLFSLRPAGTMSSKAFAQEYGGVLKQNAGRVTAIATRLLESRP